MIEDRHSLVILALVTGALFKHVTLLVIPIALVYSLFQLKDWKSRFRYLVITGVISGTTGLYCLSAILGGLENDRSEFPHVYVHHLPAGHYPHLVP